MNKQTLAVVVGAIVVFAVAVISAMAFTGGDSGNPIMTMPDGSTMPTDQMSTAGTTTTEDGAMDDMGTTP